MLLLLVAAAASEVAKEPELITEPRPGQEYVLVTSRNNTQPPAAAAKHDASGKDDLALLQIACFFCLPRCWALPEPV